MTDTTPTRSTILAALDRWTRQRPGLEFGNYGDATTYRRELRAITKQRATFRTLLRAVEQSSMDAQTLLGGFRAYSGRLTLEPDPKHPGAVRLDYCTGQYWPTEYRAAACAVLAAALWDYYREGWAASAKPGESAGDSIRRNFRRMFGRSIQQAWLD